MDGELIYRVNNDSLIIEKCPSVLTKEMISNMQTFKYKNIVLCEGIEKFEDSCFLGFKNLKSIRLPTTLKEISSRCFENSGLKEIVLPDALEVVGIKAFNSCIDLKKVSFSKSLLDIKKEAFSNCFDLEEIVLPDNLKNIGESCFYRCVSLKEVIVPNGVRELKKRVFYGCRDLRKVKLSDDIKSIGVSSFEGCSSLVDVEGLEYVSKILDSAFYECYNLRKVKLSSSLKEISPRSFAFCGIDNIDVPNSVKEIKDEAFFSCSSLKDVKISPNVVGIGNSAFYGCSNLQEINNLKNIEVIGSKCFKNCMNLKTLDLPKQLKKMGNDVFEGCSSLKKIEFPFGKKEIKGHEFSSCLDLEEIVIPSSIETFNSDSFKECSSLKKVVLDLGNRRVSFFLEKGEFIDNVDNALMFYDRKLKTYSFYNDGEFIEFDKSLLLNNRIIRKMIESDKIDSRYYLRLYYWANKRYLPGSVVIKNMPVSDIGNFYLNNNGQVWNNLISICPNVSLEENKASFFKLCYVLGLFDSKASIRDKAYDFISKKIVGVLDGYTIHNKFDGFCLDNGFNEEYAQFFMKYFNYSDFMIYKDEDFNEINLIAASYNNFDNVKKVYPGKRVHTNRDADMLLPSHVINVVKNNFYHGVDDGNEDFAFVVGKYGYNQEQFEKLQEFYNVSKSVSEDEMKIFIDEDEKDYGIVYSVLDKKDPLCAVLGNITNCCQVVSGLGESCLKYGMVMPNSCFITFNYKDKIIGQSWVWYDLTTKTVCLDNIEVPDRYSEDIRHNEDIKNSFIDCLYRIERNIKRAMKVKGLEVNKVTVGRGHNDIREILDVSFKVLEDCDSLSGYAGYSDAQCQYEICKLKKGVLKIK